ncbi:MAG: hypothetical protein CL798_06635 [Chromatiales bacterium]|nr:hypothetical protein [Chromatiales bacterium]
MGVTPTISLVPASSVGASVNVLTHCNAGSPITVHWGTANAPMYIVWQQSISVQKILAFPAVIS